VEESKKLPKSGGEGRRMNEKELPINQVICGDTLETLKTFPAESIDCVITSPPYYGLRNYGIEGQIGLEKTPEEYLNKLREIMIEIKRVLKKTGTVWWNMGDTYSPSKCLLMIPERFALMCIDLGFILRNKIIWHKPNAMPSSVKDRFSNCWEYLFLFSKSKKYYFDLDAVREKHKWVEKDNPLGKNSEGIIRAKTFNESFKGKMSMRQAPEPGEPNAFHPLGKNPGDVILHKSTSDNYSIHMGDNPLGKNPGDVIKLKEDLRREENPMVHHGESSTTFHITKERAKQLGLPVYDRATDFWSITTQPFKEAHFAVFPEKLCERPILAGCPEQVCKKCGKPRERITKREEINPRIIDGVKSQEQYSSGKKGFVRVKSRMGDTVFHTVGYTECNCNAGFAPGIVLDPFCGSGTALVVAKRLGRNFIGIDIKPEYCEMARKRLEKVPVRIDRIIKVA
jgi:DNA modification methylase